MKKILVLILVSLSFTACTKETKEEPKKVVMSHKQSMEADEKVIKSYMDLIVINQHSLTEKKLDSIFDSSYNKLLTVEGKNYLVNKHLELLISSEQK